LNPAIPTVTVVTPSYQHCRFIEATMHSVLRQEGDFYLDYIVVDGGSQDGTVEVVRDLAAQVQSGNWPVTCRGIEFRWLSEPDRGQPHAINKGFALARGTIVAWLNSDDTYVDAGTLSRVVQFFRDRPEAQFVYGRGYAIDERGRILHEERYVTDYPVELLPEVDMILQPSTFWRRSVLELVGPLNEDMCYAFDWEYWMRCQRHFELHFLDVFLATNRMHPETKTTTGGIRRKEEIARLLLRLGAFTERSIQAYLAPPPKPASKVSSLARAPLHFTSPAQRFWHHLGALGRPALKPTRLLEQQFRRLRKAWFGQRHQAAAER
jgi:glycosyltransferase involved in cell wall biosynthesis